MRLLHRVLALVLAAVFIYACMDKLVHPDRFAASIRAYRLLPDMLVNGAAVWLPWLELTIGVLLIVNRWTAGALLLANLLLVVFTMALGVNAVRGIDVNCGCFMSDPGGAAGSMAWYITRDILFLAVGFGAAWTNLRSTRNTADDQPA
ncbi:MAG: MauE/DoxX family redox-associated membrane protein [Oceanidesulfovibrio sp.]